MGATQTQSSQTIILPSKDGHSAVRVEPTSILITSSLETGCTILTSIKQPQHTSTGFTATDPRADRQAKGSSPFTCITMCSTATWVQAVGPLGFTWSRMG